MYFPVVIHQENNSAHGATVPDIPGCYSAGDRLEDALENVTRAIYLHLDGMIEDGEEIPFAGDVINHMENAAFADGIWVMVPIQIDPYLGKPENIEVTLPCKLVDEIDKYVCANSNYQNRSGFLKDAAIKQLQKSGSTIIV